MSMAACKRRRPSESPRRNAARAAWSNSLGLTLTLRPARCEPVRCTRARAWLVIEKQRARPDVDRELVVGGEVMVESGEKAAARSWRRDPHPGRRVERPGRFGSQRIGAHAWITAAITAKRDRKHNPRPALGRLRYIAFAMARGLFLPAKPRRCLHAARPRRRRRPAAAKARCRTPSSCGRGCCARRRGRPAVRDMFPCCSPSVLQDQVALECDRALRAASASTGAPARR